MRAALLAMGVLAALRLVAAGTVPLIDDEAYYWLWAQRLDWSYLDHPPMIAYLIAAGTALADSPVWVRLPALALGMLTTYALFLLGRDLFGPRAGVLAALLFQLTPVLAGAGFLATPDAPLFLAWVAAMRALWRIFGGPAPAPLGAWLAAGLAVGLGFLSKFAIVLLPLGAAVVAAGRRRVVRGPGPWLGAAVAATCTLPVLWWNLTHRWAAVRFVLFERVPGTATGWLGVVQLLTQQFAFALLLFPAFAWALVAAWRRRRDARFGFLCWTALPTVAMPAAAAWVSGAPHGNWLGPAYLGLAAVLGALWPRATGALAALSGAILAYGFAVAVVPVLPPLPGAEDLYGWPQAAARVQAELAALPPGAVIAADRYQVAAQLAYYTRWQVPVTLLPEPNPASIWTPPAALAGRDAVAVVDARWTPHVAWERHAGHVEEAPPEVVHFHGRPLRTFRVFRLRTLLAAPGPASGPAPRRTGAASPPGRGK
jgi:4-amino-4-deoxy-L-arabinose transferase-like glycosyltransferase